VKRASEGRGPVQVAAGADVLGAAGAQILSRREVEAVSPLAVARWGEVLLLEDDSARALRRGATGVSDRADRVLIRVHRIGSKGATIAGERTYLPRSGGAGALLRSDLALELLDELATKRAVVVCGPTYGASARFLDELHSRGMEAVVEIRPSSLVDLSRARLGRGSFQAWELLDDATWRRFSIRVAGRDDLSVSYSAARIGSGSVVSGPRGVLFAALTGGINGVHPGTVFGFSLDTEAALSELLQAVGWVRWIRPIIRRKERDDELRRRASDDNASDGVNGSRRRLRANIKLSRLHDAEASALRLELNRPDFRGALARPGSPVNVVELFAGAGGMGLGFMMAQAGRRDATYRLIYSGEVDPIYAQTLRWNHSRFAEINPQDRSSTPVAVAPVDLRSPEAVREIEGQARAWGGADVVIGGPPCQGFSNANRNSWNSANPHNQLIDVFMHYVEKLAPKAFLLENVQGIHWTRTRPGGTANSSVLDYIDVRMAKAGYDVFVHLLDAVWYGVPQYRSRFFVLGLHRDLGYSSADFEPWGPFPSPSHGPGTERPYTTVREAISDLPRVGNGHSKEEMAYEDPHHPANDYLTLIRSGATEGVITDHVTSRHADYVIERYRKIPPGGNWESIAESLTNYADVKRTHSNIYRRLKWAEPSITIGHYRKSMLVHPSQHRGLSLREAARLQSFPDWFQFAGSATGGSGGLVHKQQQLANAVCPLVTRAIAESILKL